MYIFVQISVYSCTDICTKMYKSGRKPEGPEPPLRPPGLASPRRAFGCWPRALLRAPGLRMPAASSARWCPPRLLRRLATCPSFGWGRGWGQTEGGEATGSLPTHRSFEAGRLRLSLLLSTLGLQPRSCLCRAGIGHEPAALPLSGRSGPVPHVSDSASPGPCIGTRLCSCIGLRPAPKSAARPRPARGRYIHNRNDDTLDFNIYYFGKN